MDRALLPAAASAGIEERKRASWRAFEGRKTLIEGLPFRASIELTRNCNFRCVMCPQSWMPEYAAYRPEFNMSPELFGKVASELFPHLEYAHLQGFGESVISPHFGRILDLCEPYRPRLRLGLVTNLGRRDDELWLRMARMGFQVRFSCDGATREVFEAVRRRSSFDLILHNLELLRRTGLLSFNVTLQKANWRQMPLFVELASRYGAKEVLFSSVQRNLPRTVPEMLATLRKLARMGPAHALAHVRRGLSRREEDPSLRGLPRGPLAELAASALEAGGRLGVRVLFNDLFLERLARAPRAGRLPGAEDEDYAKGIEESVRVAEKRRCFKPYSYAVVNYLGQVGLCNHLIADDAFEPLGSLKESSLREIWDSPAYRRMRALLAGGTPAAKGCRWCFAHRVAE